MNKTNSPKISYYIVQDWAFSRGNPIKLPRFINTIYSNKLVFHGVVLDLYHIISKFGEYSLKHRFLCRARAKF